MTGETPVEVTPPCGLIDLVLLQRRRLSQVAPRPCRLCRWWRQHLTTPLPAICCFGPPAIVIGPDGAVRNVYPTTPPEYGCSHWERMPGGRGDR